MSPEEADDLRVGARVRMRTDDDGLIRPDTIPRRGIVVRPWNGDTVTVRFDGGRTLRLGRESLDALDVPLAAAPQGSGKP